MVSAFDAPGAAPLDDQKYRWQIVLQNSAGPISSWNKKQVLFYLYLTPALESDHFLQEGKNLSLTTLSLTSFWFRAASLTTRILINEVKL